MVSQLTTESSGDAYFALFLAYAISAKSAGPCKTISGSGLEHGARVREHLRGAAELIAAAGALLAVVRTAVSVTAACPLVRYAGGGALLGTVGVVAVGLTVAIVIDAIGA
jgi:hypothetical protein